MAFTQIIDLYDSAEGVEDSAVVVARDKYVNFKDEKLTDVIDALKKVKLITEHTKLNVVMDHYSTAWRSLSWWLLKVHKFFRYIFVSFYYYLTPFFILVFQSVLLYSNEIYTQ